MATTTSNKGGARFEMVMEQLIEAAERLFAQQGYAGTSLQELAAAVGLTRTGVYHYIRSKEDLLEYLVRGFTLETARDLERLAADREADVVPRLREGVRNMAMLVAHHPKRFRLLLNSESEFPDSLAKQYRLARRRSLTALTDLVSQAIVHGECRPVDAELAAFSLLGAANWVSFWYPRPSGDGALPPDQLATRLTDIALGGIIAPRPVSRAGSIDEVIGHLREDLDRLERMVDGKNA
jgi:AcrR family transcriptional regulator